MLKFLKVTLCLTVLSSLVFVGGCEKFRDNREPVTTIDNSLAIESFDDVFKKVVEHARLNDAAVGKTAIDTCASIAIATTGGNFPKTMTSDFGSDNCTGLYGVERRGRIISNFSAPFQQDGSVVSITLDGYHVNNYWVQGVMIIRNMGQNASGNIEFSVQVNDGVITSVGEDVISWGGTRTFEWVSGSQTVVFVWDDVYAVTGSATGINREARGFDMAITESIVVQVGCHWPISGVLEIKPFELKDREVDYGDGVCDNHVDLTIGKRRELSVNLR